MGRDRWGNRIHTLVMEIVPVEDRKTALDLISVHSKFQRTEDLRNFTVNSGEGNLSYDQVKCRGSGTHAESKR